MIDELSRRHNKAARLISTESMEARAHLLHRRADVGIVLKELRRQSLVDAVLFRQLKRDAHQVEAEHAHPARRVRLFEMRTFGERLAAVEDRDVVEPEEAALEDVVALRVHLVHPPGEVDQELVEALLKELAVGLPRTHADPCCRRARRPTRGPAD